MAMGTERAAGRALARARAGKALSVDELEALLAARGDQLAELLRIAARLRDLGHGTTVTYSRKVFIPLTMLCRDHCHYCTFAKPPAKLERPFLSPVPQVRFDTDYVETRRVHNIVPFVSVDGGRYGVPPDVLGQLVEIRRPVDSREFTVRCAGKLIVTHHLAENPGSDIVWQPEHRAATEAIALASRPTTAGRHLHLVAPPTAEPVWEQLELGDGDFDVDTPDLDARYGIGGELP